MPVQQKNNIIEGLIDLGLKQGNIVLLHSSLASIGHVEGGPNAVIDAFLEVLGSTGTLVVPTFGDLGIITKTLKSRPDAIESCHPLARVAAIGKDAEVICADHWKAPIPHAEDTPYTRIANMGGYVCLLGVDQDRNTTIHAVEGLLRLPYMKTSNEQTFDTPEGELTKQWHFVPGPHRDFIQLDKLFRASSKMKIGTIGNSLVRLIKSKDLIDICIAANKKNPASFLCDNPNCPDCIIQRAKINCYQFEQESFTLAVSAAFAGFYIPEIIKKLDEVGINHVELDYLEGIPISDLTNDKILSAINELQQNGLIITALRLNAVPDTTDILDIANTNSIKRIIMPLSESVAEWISLAEKKQISISLYNANIRGSATSKLLLALSEQPLKFGFTFNPSNFATCGEKPFRNCYKKKLKRFIEQLDVEDTLFDGTTVPIGIGNAEIKELISILRCANFSGLLLIGQRNRFSGENLSETIERFKHVLANM